MRKVNERNGEWSLVETEPLVKAQEASGTEPLKQQQGN